MEEEGEEEEVEEDEVEEEAKLLFSCVGQVLPRLASEQGKK